MRILRGDDVCSCHRYSEAICKIWNRRGKWERKGKNLQIVVGLFMRNYALTNVRFYTNTRSPCGDLYSCKNPRLRHIIHKSVSPHFPVIPVCLSRGKKLLCHMLNDVVDLRVSSHRLQLTNDQKYVQPTRLKLTTKHRWPTSIQHSHIWHESDHSVYKQLWGMTRSDPLKYRDLTKSLRTGLEPTEPVLAHTQVYSINEHIAQ